MNRGGYKTKRGKRVISWGPLRNKGRRPPKNYRLKRRQKRRRRELREGKEDDQTQRPTHQAGMEALR